MNVIRQRIYINSARLKKPGSLTKMPQSTSAEGKQRSSIKAGSKVQIILKADQRSGKLTEGTVASLLTNSQNHPHGIKVKLKDGQTFELRMARTRFTINFLGDVMLGRLIDQCFPTHVHEPDEAASAASFKSRFPSLEQCGPSTPWGSTMPLLHEADLNLINLETSATTSTVKWPNKVFNYRMHPANIEALKVAKIRYATLANNHTLDFSENGLEETVRTVREAGIAIAGAGFDRDEALSPAELRLPVDDGELDAHNVLVWAGSDHPSDWSKVPQFHLIDYSLATKARLKQMMANDPHTPRPSLKIFSIHWGPNYSWQPDDDIRSLAHYLIDECDVDIIHGHSSHHLQGVEAYKGKLIMYGCGDFVDDYALVPNHRNDLSGVWRVTVGDNGEQLVPESLELFPTRIKQFQAQRLWKDEADYDWVKAKFSDLSRELGTQVQDEVGKEGQLVVNIGQ
ncbi:MAG: hypothetical protein M1828_004364 [Chrysothrix sp. TS-e1954]|nr:MAG: hypothetical protein M1828_004364 [Chrysothrix sp. TS-e1954]